VVEVVDPLDGRVDIAFVVCREGVKQVREAEDGVERCPEVVNRFAYGIRRDAWLSIPAPD
jgi:hypothetical protein